MSGYVPRNTGAPCSGLWPVSQRRASGREQVSVTHFQACLRALPVKGERRLPAEKVIENRPPASSPTPARKTSEELTTNRHLTACGARRMRFGCGIMPTSKGGSGAALCGSVSSHVRGGRQALGSAKPFTFVPRLGELGSDARPNSLSPVTGPHRRMTIRSSITGALAPVPPRGRGKGRPDGPQFQPVAPGAQEETALRISVSELFTCPPEIRDS